MIFGEEHTICFTTVSLNCSVLVRTAIEKLKLGYVTNPIAATLFPSIAFEIPIGSRLF